MARFKIKSPSGETITINTPDDNPPPQHIIQKAVSSMQSSQAQPQQQPQLPGFFEQVRKGIPSPEERQKGLAALPLAQERTKLLRPDTQDVLGAVEGLTLGIPRAGIEQATGQELPRGSEIGQLLGSVLGAGKVFGLARRIPGLSKSLVRTGALTGGAISQAPLSTEIDAPLDERIEKGFAGTALGGIAGTLPGVAEVLRRTPGAAARFGANIPNIVQKDLRNILSRLGRKKAFSQPVDRKGFIADNLVPRVTMAATKRIEELNPQALRRLKIPQDVIDDVSSVKQRFGLKKIPRPEEASELFDKTIRNAPDDLNINVKSFKGKLGGLLRRIGVIDERGNQIPGIGKDNRIITGLVDIHNNLKSRIRLNRPERLRFLLRRQPISPEASAFRLKTGTKGLSKENQALLRQATEQTDMLDKTQWLRTKFNLKGLLSGDNEVDRFVFEMIESLDDSAIRSGVEGLDKAKAIFRVSKGLNKAFTFLDDPNLEKNIQTNLLGLKNQERGVEKNFLRQLIGSDEADEIIDFVDLNRILTSPGELGRPTGSGFFTAGRGLARRGVRKFEEQTASIQPSPSSGRVNIKDIINKALGAQ